ncbi:uncharacterized protein LOC124914663 [Impatiens glandulifera]|uniref:uncharacterized protein LOC124914663 n=1 Tax=Impatiens glandulifera TaxID=253017 RepID=UPI001FB09BC5|nr:uncharacterized protein LOC124914663 [Impatiens glandulifera]
MAKGWKLTTSRSERFLGSYSYGQGHVSYNEDSPELEEEDVWSTMVDDHVNGSGGAGSQDQSMMNGSSYREWETRAPMQIGGGMNGRGRIHQDDRPVGGLSLAFDDNRRDQQHVSSPRILHQYRGGVDGFQSTRGRHMATSAPVNVPDWSKIYCVDSVESMHDSDDGAEDRDSEEIVPPHEYLAQEYRKMAAHSVFEGVGRTLKGRDMRRVRDAVWSQTGFDG